MARKQHTHHYIYKTTCKVTGKFYVGMHSTSDLEDDYMGSGKRLWLSIRKHGKENHEKEILEWFPDRDSLKGREKEMVNEELLLDPMCMNLKIGGEGGNLGPNGKFFGGDKFKAASTWWKNADRELTSVLTSHLRKRENVEKACESKFEKTGSRNGWKGRTHGEKYKEKMSQIMSERQKGDKNSQFGTIWINDGKTSKKIRKTDSIPEGWTRGRK